MKYTPAQVAQFLSLTWVPVSISHHVLHVVQGGDPYGVTQSVKRWDFWLALVVALYIGLRIRRHDQVAWWVGLAAAGYLLYVRVPYIPVALKNGFPFFPLGITLAWLVAFVGALIAMQFKRPKHAA